MNKRFATTEQQNFKFLFWHGWAEEGANVEQTLGKNE